MNHKVDGRKFGRNTSHRVAMLRNMANQVIEHEQIVTTVQKAKEVRRVVDRLITIGKRGLVSSRRMVFDRTRNKLVVKKLFEELGPRYASRKGGYTRVLRISERRRGDAAVMAVLELVDKVKKVPMGDTTQAAPAEDIQTRSTVIGPQASEELSPVTAG
jgi:large subunit ribosomal protein L17